MRSHVVRGQIPQDLEEQLTQPFTEEERHRIFESVGLNQAERLPEGRSPIALWLFGPPAAGKTSISDDFEVEFFGRSGNAVCIDGSHVRDAHTGFQQVLQHGIENEVIHADAWTKLKATKHVERLKEEIFEIAVRNRQNVKICDACQKPDRVRKMLALLEGADFEMHALCLWVPEVATQSRGQHRSVESKRVLCTSLYASSSSATLDFAKHWDEQIRQGNPRYKSLGLLDNTPRPPLRISLEEFEARTNWPSSEAAQHFQRFQASAKEG